MALWDSPARSPSTVFVYSVLDLFAGPLKRSLCVSTMDLKSRGIPGRMQTPCRFTNGTQRSGVNNTYKHPQRKHTHHTDSAMPLCDHAAQPKRQIVTTGGMLPAPPHDLHHP